MVFSVSSPADASSECDEKELPLPPSSFGSGSADDEEARSTPPPPRARRLSENRGLTLKVDTGIVEKSLYFPGCGKALPLDIPSPGREPGSASSLAQRRSSLRRSGSSPRTLSLSSSPSASGGDDDSPVERLSIVLTQTGFVEDVVTPWQPTRSAEDAFFNTDGANTVGPEFRSLPTSKGDTLESGASTPPTPPPAAGKAKRRVSFTDEKGAGGDGESQPLVSMHVFSSERAVLDRLSTLSDRDSEPGQSFDPGPADGAADPDE